MMPETVEIDPTGLKCPVPIVGAKKRTTQLDAGEQITERKRAENALQARNEELVRERANLQTIFDAVPVGMLLVDTDAQVTQVNDAVTQLVGKEASDLLSRQPGDGLCCIHAGETPAGCGHAAACPDCPVRNTVEQVLKEGRPIRNAEATMRLVIGGEEKQFCFAVNATPLTLGGNKHALLTLADITDRKRAEDSLRESRDRFERVATSVSDLIYEWNVTTDQLEWVGDINATLGYPPGTIPPTIEGWLALIHPDDHKKIADAVEHQRRSPKPINVTYRIRHKDGQWRHWEDRGSAILDDAGSPVRVIGACSDVTERTRAEEALRESEQRFLDVLHAADDAILLIDAETFVDCNDATARMLRYACRDDFLMTHPSELSPPEQPDGRSSFEKAGEMIRTAFEKGFHRFEWMHRKADGEDFPVEVSLTPITYQGKAILHCLWRDLTERKQAQAERNRLQEKLLETSRLAGMAEVATGVLHNVGNVLNSVNVSAQVVADRVRTSRIAGLAKANALMDQHTEDLGTFITEDERGRHLPGYLHQLSDQLHGERDSVLEELGALMQNIEHIKEIVSMQQSYATKSGVTMQVSFADLVEDALKANDASLLRHEVELLREYEELPQVTTDKHKVLQILVNLISNAKHALIASDSTKKQITLRAGRSGEDRVIVEVQDNGVGIPTENQTRIFQHGFTTKKNGHGFGLHSSALAAKELGGSLTVHSDGPGHGATFSLTLPVKPTQELGRECELSSLRSLDSCSVFDSVGFARADYVAVECGEI